MSGTYGPGMLGSQEEGWQRGEGGISEWRGLAVFNADVFSLHIHRNFLSCYKKKKCSVPFAFKQVACQLTFGSLFLIKTQVQEIVYFPLCSTGRDPGMETPRWQVTFGPSVQGC